MSTDSNLIPPRTLVRDVDLEGRTCLLERHERDRDGTHRLAYRGPDGPQHVSILTGDEIRHVYLPFGTFDELNRQTRPDLFVRVIDAAWVLAIGALDTSHVPPQFASRWASEAGVWADFGVLLNKFATHYLPAATTDKSRTNEAAFARAIEQSGGPIPSVGSRDVRELFASIDQGSMLAWYWNSIAVRTLSVELLLTEVRQALSEMIAGRR